MLQQKQPVGFMKIANASSVKAGSYKPYGLDDFPGVQEVKRDARNQGLQAPLQRTAPHQAIVRN